MTEPDQGSMDDGSRESSDSLDFAVEAARLLEDRHCTEVQLLDLRGISQVCDWLAPMTVIGSQ